MLFQDILWHLVREQSVIKMWKCGKLHQNSCRRRRLDSQAEHVESKQRLLGQQSNAGEVRQVQRGKSPETGRGRKIRQAGTGTLWQEGHNRKSGRVLPQGYKAGKPGRIMTDWGAGVEVDVEVRWWGTVVTRWGQLGEWEEHEMADSQWPADEKH